MRRSITIIALLLGLPLPFLTAAVPASAASVPAITVNSATLVANGAGVQLGLTATCGAGDIGGINATITQAVGNHIAQGSITPISFTCTGAPQPISAVAAANVNGAPFRTGVALVMASLSDCPGANCTNVSTDKVVRIQR